MRRGYSPIVLLGMGFTMLRQALTAALILLMVFVTLQNWGPDLTPVTDYVNTALRQVVTG